MRVPPAGHCPPGPCRLKEAPHSKPGGTDQNAQSSTGHAAFQGNSSTLGERVQRPGHPATKGGPEQCQGAGRATVPEQDEPFSGELLLKSQLPAGLSGEGVVPGAAAHWQPLALSAGVDVEQGPVGCETHCGDGQRGQWYLAPPGPLAPTTPAPRASPQPSSSLRWEQSTMPSQRTGLSLQLSAGSLYTMPVCERQNITGSK